MISRFWEKAEFLACFASLLFFCAAGALAAQSPTASIRGQVTDPSGAAVTEATVLLTTPSGGSMDTVSNKEGFYEFKDLAPGNYEIKAVAKGFALFDKTGIALAADQSLRFNIPLALQEQQEKVFVNDTTTQVDVSPTNNANTIVLQGKDLEALSDDPDELESELQALAGPSAGPNGGQIYIDGFTAGQLPPKASIREIRINQNPFSSEYDRLGYGRVEIFTKPGTDKLHGQFMISGNDSAFNARNPFEILPANTPAPGYHSEQFSGNIGGAINKKASFFFNIEQRDIQALNIVSSADPNPYNPAVANPQTRTNVSPRIDYQLTPNNTLTARYQYFRDSETNDGVGQFNEAAVGTDYLSTEHTLQLTDTQTINASTINEIRFQYVHDNILTTPVSSAINVNVGGAFSNNGSGGGDISDTQNRYEVQDIIYKNFRKHAVKFGGRFRSTNDLNATAANFSGTFAFGAQSLIGCTPTPQTPCPTETPLEVYETTLQGLALALTIPEIQQKYGYGGASYYSQTFGRPSASVTLVDAGLFVQDDWKLRPNVTISYGLRFETQNNFSDKSDFAPRLGIAWGIGGNAKNPPKTVLRAGFGMFYDRFTYNLVLAQERFNESGAAQQQYLIQNPSFFLTSTANPNCVPPFTLPLPAGCSVSSSSSGTIDYQSNPNLHAPYTIQTGVTLERQLSKVANVAVTYLNSRGVHQFYTDNINPIDPENPTGARPIPSDGNNNVYQYQSEGIFKQNQLIVNGSIRMGAKLSLFGYYTLGYANSDTSGAMSFPSIPGDLQEDYGRASYDIRHRLFVGGTIGLPRGFRLSPFLIASSGIPFNITTGSDPYQDANFNVRPAFATCTSANQTKFGCFAIPPAADLGNPATYTPIPVNYGDGPGRFSLNLRLSKTFGFGPVLEGASGGAGGGPGGGGTFGRPGGGGGGPRGGPGGGRGGPDAGATNRRYALTFSVNARNVFNNVNLATPIGNLGSPLFGESNGLAGRPYSDPTSNRRLDLQVTFAF
ncbi:MAG TPA: TonB-dependent receptor [Candidatus Acidoferrum sp.]|nr:TonB-dependent receptor [Candidatus Acidoferrum sp.]